LLTGDPRSATIAAVTHCTLLRLDIVDFRQLLGRQPELDRSIRAAADARLAADRIFGKTPSSGIFSDIS
jgi:CRP-like cAMP-binding protein